MAVKACPSTIGRVSTFPTTPIGEVMQFCGALSGGSVCISTTLESITVIAGNAFLAMMTVTSAVPIGAAAPLGARNAWTSSAALAAATEPSKHKATTAHFMVLLPVLS
jgi:hypothetical protein